MDDKRRSPREPARAKARLLVDGQWHDSVVTNISSTGARLYLRKSIATGKAVRIDFAELGQYDATVVWCEGDETGLQFNHDPAEIANLLTALAS